MSDDPLLEPRPPQPSFWTPFQQKVMPEAAWTNEQKQLAGLDTRQCRGWLKCLCSTNKYIRQEALRSFQGLSSDARRLLTLLAHQSALNQQMTVRTGAVGLSLCIMVAGITSGGMVGFAAGVLLTLLIYSLTFTSLSYSRRQELAKNLLDRTHDPRLLPFLLARLHFNNINNRAPRQMLAGRNMRNAVTRLLPLAQEGDVAEWTGTPWSHLLYYLRHPHDDVEITLLALNFVARYGNEQSLRVVEAMTNKQINLEHATTIGAARTALEANRQVMQAAVEACLPPLRESVALQKQAQTLLRPSGEISSTAQDILLRPASAYIAETPAEQLLRPGSLE